VATLSKKGGALRTRCKYYTLSQESSKKKTIVSIARKLAELMYSVLRNKTTFKVLERRKQYLIEKQNILYSHNKSYFLNAEIEALTKIINFAKFCLSKIPEETMA